MSDKPRGFYPLDARSAGMPVIQTAARVIRSQTSRPIREAQRRRPGLTAILLTGFATNAAELAMSGAVSGTFSLLRKPFTVQALGERIAVLLEGAEAGS